MYTAMLDQHRIIHAITSRSTLPPEWTQLKANLIADGLTITEPTLTAFPTGYRRGRALSADNASCSDPADDHASRSASVKRRKVENWALANVSARAMRYGWRNPSRMELWLHVLRNCLAAAGNDAVIGNIPHWLMLEGAMRIDFKEFMDRAERWSDHETAIENLTGFYPPVQFRTGGPVLAQHASKVTAEQLAVGREFADRVLYGR